MNKYKPNEKNKNSNTNIIYLVCWTSRRILNAQLVFARRIKYAPQSRKSKDGSDF